MIAPILLAVPAGAMPHSPLTSCVDTDREGTAYQSTNVDSSPGGAVIATMPANTYFDYCSNTATVVGSSTWVYGEYLNSARSGWLHGWVDQSRLKNIHTIV